MEGRVMLRNYRAYSMTEALAAVRSDLGSDAVILHTRSFTQGGFLGIGRRTVVEVTAAPASEVAIDATRSRRAPGPGPDMRFDAGQEPRSASEPDAEAVPTLNLDRERTRLLAQALSVTLDREESETPRTSAGSAASANEAATRRAAGEPVAATPPKAPTVASLPPATVAQRYVLVAPERRDASVAGSLRDAPAATTIIRRPPASSAAPSLSVRPPDPTPARIERVAAPPLPPPAPPRHEPLDLDEIDRMVDQVLRRSDDGAGPARRSEGPAPPGRLAEVYAALLAQEVGKELAQRVVDEIRDSLSPEELLSEHAVRSAAIERVARLLPECQALRPAPDGSWRRDGRPLTVAFVGPTGVGKTTTVAKIAATLRLRHGARVALLTTDTYRVSAVDQLRTYADIIGAPLEVVLGTADMREATDRLRDRDVVLIDTAGRSQNDGHRLSELSALLAVAAPHETHLVLSSVAAERALMREAQAFAAVGVDRVVLTKLDESAGLGAALRVLRDVGHAISYVTMGQEVPQHIEPASAGRIAAMMVGADSAVIRAATPPPARERPSTSLAMPVGSATR